MRWIKRGIYIFVGLVAGLIALVVGAIFVIDMNQAAQGKVFYDARPMLRAMRDAQPGVSRTTVKDDPWPQYSKILLQHVPIGSTHEDAMRVLSFEGIRCEPSIGQERLMVCGATWRPSHVPRWHIELRFDQDDKVSGGRVLALKATAT